MKKGFKSTPTKACTLDSFSFSSEKSFDGYLANHVKQNLKENFDFEDIKSCIDKKINTLMKGKSENKCFEQYLKMMQMGIYEKVQSITNEIFIESLNTYKNLFTSNYKNFEKFKDVFKEKDFLAKCDMNALKQQIQNVKKQFSYFSVNIKELQQDINTLEDNILKKEETIKVLNDLTKKVCGFNYNVVDSNFINAIHDMEQCLTKFSTKPNTDNKLLEEETKNLKVSIRKLDRIVLDKENEILRTKRNFINDMSKKRYVPVQIGNNIWNKPAFYSSKKKSKSLSFKEKKIVEFERSENENDTSTIKFDTKSIKNLNNKDEKKQKLKSIKKEVKKKNTAEYQKYRLRLLKKYNVKSIEEARQLEKKNKLKNY